MSKNEWKKWISVAGRLLLAFVFVFSETALAGQNQQTKDKAESPQKAAAPQTINKKQSSAASTAKTQSNQAQSEESESSVAEEKSPGDGRHEGIKVHGHWTIEVRNSDGTVVTRHEFENSLAGGTTGGGQALAGFLGRLFSTSFWLVRLDGTGICGASSGASAACVIEEGGGGAIFPTEVWPSYGFAAPNSQNLTVGTSNTGTDLILSGSVTTLTAGQITGVDSFVLGCPPSNPPSNPAGAPCAGFKTGQAVFSFTSRSLDGLNGDPQGPISVASGQMIAVTVDISFS